MIENLEAELARCQIADAWRLRRQFQQLQQGQQQKAGKQSAARAEELLRALRASQQACEKRAAAIPEVISFPEQLPVSKKADDIADLLRENQVIVVAGDTGSGKTTQLPKICLQAGLGRRGLIGHTQPRRLAAVSVANRIAEELQTTPGAGVGYQVRFNEKVSPDSYLKVMTDGILLAEIQQDRFLNRYEVIIIDEAHERSLNIDFLLGFFKQLLERRTDLKLVITSATIDVEKFSRHFAKAPIVTVSGRTYPVEVRYAPLDQQRDITASDVQAEAIVDQVRRILGERKQGKGGVGDILVFLSGEREIRETAQLLRKQRLPQLEVLPLYARLRHAEQVKIFQPHKGVRVVLATNVAETSLTVPGINYVIDTGLARISRYSLQSKVQRLPIEPVSQASANQRKGRCGRLADGICVRLYSEQDFESRPPYTDPEIRRTNLASVILRMKHLRLGEAERFPFIEPPEGRAINEGIKLLIELDALTPQKKLTPAGRQMATMPVDPRLARMLITANREHCLNEILIIVSALSIQDPREIGADNRQQAREKLAQFEHPDSDFLGFVNLWNDYEQRRQSMSQGQLRKYCKTHFLNYMRMREWREVHRQLWLSCQQLGFRLNQQPGSYEQVHRCIIAGSLNQIACLQEGREYLGNRNRKFFLFPGSVLSQKPSKWIVTGELIETSQTFASLAARIQPQWVERMALHLVKREHYEPHWSKKRQEVVAFEKVQLYGLTIIDKALVSYGAMDPATSRELFIREALAAGGIETNEKFYRDNRRLLAELARQEEKIRRPEFIVGERDIVEFYEQRLPEQINSTRDLEAWLRKQGKSARQALTMQRETLLRDKNVLGQAEAYPDQAPIQHNTLKIDYQFDPGNSRDGATLEVPVAILNQLTRADVDWAVPGILRDKCIVLLKSLPKALRKNFIPVSGFVDEVLPKMSNADGDLVDALIAQIRIARKLNLRREDFADAEMPRHLITKIRVLDEAGEELDFSDDLDKLKREKGQQGEALTSAATGSYGHDLEQQGLTDWSFDALPEQLSLGDELVLVRYPALVDRGDSVDVKLFADPYEAKRHNLPGLLRLYMLNSVQQRNMLRKQFIRFVNRHALLIPKPLSDLAEQAVSCAYRLAFATDSCIPRDREAFQQALENGKSRIHRCANQLEELLERILTEQWQIRSQLADLKAPELAYVRADIEAQLDALFVEDFLLDNDWVWLQEYPRFLQAINVRLEKAPFLGPRDKPNTEELQALWQRYLARAEQVRLSKPEPLQTLRWMLEEYRVSLFAQKLGTRIPVSAKRLDKQFTLLESP